MSVYREVSIKFNVSFIVVFDFFVLADFEAAGAPLFAGQAFC